MHHPRIGALAALSLLTLAACGGEEPTVAPDPVEVRITVSPIYRVIEAGTTLQLNTTITGTTNRNATWSIVSPGTGGGSISSSGLYTAPLEIAGDSLAVIVRAVVTGDTASATARISVRPGPLAALRIPGLDSRYLYDFHETDTNGVKVPGSEKTVVDTVVAVMQSMGGRDSVFTVRRDRRILHMRYDAAGNLAQYDDPEIRGRWLRWPTGGGSGERITIEDSVHADGRRRLQYIETSYLGRETATYKGRKYTAHKVRVVSVQEREGAEWFRLRWEDTYWFAPALGWYVRVDELSRYTDAVDDWTMGRHSTLREAIVN